MKDDDKSFKMLDGFPKGIITFRELFGSPEAAPSLANHRAELSVVTAELCATYLRNGYELIKAPMRTFDAFDPTQCPSDVPGWSTDGEWLWNAALPYYVQRYQVGLPEEFVAKIVSMSGKPPRVPKAFRVHCERVLDSISQWKFQSE